MNPDCTTHGYAIRAPRPDEIDEARALMIRVIEQDYGYDYRSRWHDDVIDPNRFFLVHPRQTLLVAVDHHSGQLLGTAGIRVFRITSPPHPAEIVERYDRERTAELTRVFVLPEARRRGIGRALVESARNWAADVGGFDLIQFHSRTAVGFWRALPTTVVLDARRPGGDGPEYGQVYFEMAMPVADIMPSIRPAGDQMKTSTRSDRVVVPPINTGRGSTVREVTPADFAEARASIVRVLEEDLKTGYMPQCHWDIDDMQGTYLDNRRQAMFVAVDHASHEVIGTIAVRTDGPTSPPHPSWLAERYAPDTACQLFRAYIACEHRRRGVARALVEAARRFIRDEGGYDTIYLHTNPSVPGAEPFWRAMPTTEIFDARREEGAPGSNALHFELEMLPAEAPASTSRLKT